MVNARVGWRWSNIPIPEPHLGGLVVGTVIHLLRPRTFVDDQQRARAVGLGLIGSGLLLIGWAVRTMGSQESQNPTTLATTGPYAFSRNPMYVGWTVLYFGVMLVLNTVWLFVLLPVVIASSHWIIRQEERSLERVFGGVYRAYRREVRRYL